jgi:hypothetical protein
MLLPLAVFGRWGVLADLSALAVRVCPSGCGIGLLGVGLVVHLAVGTLLGALYVASQQRAPLRGVVAVAVFYGVFLWVVSRFVTSHWVPDPLGALLRSWHWLVATLWYAIALALTAWWIDVSRAATAEEIVQLD